LQRYEGADEEPQQNFAWRSGETSMYSLRFSYTSVQNFR